MNYVEELLSRAGLVDGKTSVDLDVFREEITQEDAKGYLEMIGWRVPQHAIRVMVLNLLILNANHSERVDVRLSVLSGVNEDLHEEWRRRFSRSRSSIEPRFGAA